MQIKLFQDRGLDGTIFQNPHKLHLTIGTLPLMNDKEISQATDLLHQCQQELVESVSHGFNSIVQFEFH